VTPVSGPEVEWANATPVPGEIEFPRFTTDCTACKGCELICSFFREGKNNPALSRIRIRLTDIEWIKGKADKIVEQKVCKQCPGIPMCMIACPVEGALYRDSETGAVVVNDELCIRCKKCVEACPFEAVWYNERADKILKCDLCGGEPKCVEWCPVECLKFERIL